MVRKRSSLANVAKTARRPELKRHSTRDNLLHNKTFYEVVVETGSKRSENASIERKVS